MKKTNQIIKTGLAIAAITMFVACTKDPGMISKTGTGYTGGTGTADSATAKKTTGYVGSSTLGDSATTKKGY